jgi:hypothetical protein
MANSAFQANAFQNNAFQILIEAIRKRLAKFPPRYLFLAINERLMNGLAIRKKRQEDERPEEIIVMRHTTSHGRSPEHEHSRSIYGDHKR